MAFTVPYGSSPPSTPDKSPGSFFNASTASALPPPLSAASFTPLGPPPSSTLGSSQMSSRSRLSFSESAMSQSGGFNGSESGFPSFMSSGFSSTKNGASGSLFGSPFQFGTSTGSHLNGPRGPRDGTTGVSKLKPRVPDSATDVEGLLVEKGDGYDNDRPPGVGNSTSLNKAKDLPDDPFGFFESQFSSPRAPTSEQRKTSHSNPDNPKRAKLDEHWATSSPSNKINPRPAKKLSKLQPVIQNLASQSTIAKVTEPGAMIIETEDKIGEIYDKARDVGYNESDFKLTLSELSTQLTSVWESFAGKEGPLSRLSTADGAGDSGGSLSGITKACCLGSLLLLLHHPPLMRTHPGALRGSAVRFSSQALAVPGSNPGTYTPTPKVLLDWLNENHTLQKDDLKTLRGVSPNPTASPNFWDVVQTAVLRGRFTEVADLLRFADFNHARSALEDGSTHPGYRGAQLQNIQSSVNKAIQLLESSPSIQHGDWDVNGADWALHRKRISSAMTDLEEFAEGQNVPLLTEQSPRGDTGFQAVNFGLPQTRKPVYNEFSFTQSSRMAESRVPWSIYQNLKMMYGIMRGDTTTIMARAQDWIEATIGLTVWWDGEGDSKIADQTSDVLGSNCRNGISRIKSLGRMCPDSRIEGAYLRRLDYSFTYVTDGSSGNAGYQLNLLNSLEVGLGALFEGNVEGVLGLLQTWSLCIASAVAEVASAGGWLERPPGARPLSNFLNQDDLMVLSYRQGEDLAPRGIQKDDILILYAVGLFERDLLGNESSVRPGWEMALESLVRLDDAGAMQKKAAELLEKLPLNTIEQMDKAVLLCTDLGLEGEGRKVCEKYGDNVTFTSDDYGVALICYARARCTRKLKSVVELLTSYSLVQSRAFPETEKLDEQLRALLKDPRTCLSAIAAIDAEAAHMLQFYFSGYAALRRFYETRDESNGLPPRARKRAAAQALTAVVRSSADSIYGGLYDPDRDSAVQVDGLLALLGEALEFINGPTPILNVSQQLTILSAIEDLETVTPRVFTQCEECFRSTLLAYHSERAAFSGDRSASPSFALTPSPRSLLKKSVSSLTASSSFSLIGSEMAESQTRLASGSTSGVLVPRPKAGGDAVIKRGWDWRAGLLEDAKGRDILRALRLGLARGLSFGALG